MDAGSLLLYTHALEGEGLQKVELQLQDVARVQLEGRRQLLQYLSLCEGRESLDVARAKIVLASARGRRLRRYGWQRAARREADRGCLLYTSPSPRDS